VKDAADSAVHEGQKLGESAKGGARDLEVCPASEPWGDGGMGERLLRIVCAVGALPPVQLLVVPTVIVLQQCAHHQCHPSSPGHMCTTILTLLATPPGRCGAKSGCVL
jgi:hypothetical protein